MKACLRFTLSSWTSILCDMRANILTLLARRNASSIDDRSSIALAFSCIINDRAQISPHSRQLG